MTVATTHATDGPYVGNGVTTVFPFTFSVGSVDEVAVFVDGVETVSGFTVTANTGGNGGNVTFSVAPTADEVVIAMDPDFTQTVSFENAGAFLPSTHDRALDKLTRQSIYLLNMLDRSIVAPLGESFGPLAGADDRAGYYLSFDAEGDPVVASGTGADAGLRTDLAASTGASLSGYINSGTGATARTLQARLRETVYAKDYGAVADGVTNDHAAIQAAINTGARNVILPDGTCIVGDGILRPLTGQRITGTPGKTKLSKTVSPGAYRTKPFFEIEDVTDVIIEGIEMDYLGSQFEFGVVVRATSLASTRRVTIRDCVFSRCYAFVQRYVHDVDIENNKFLLDGLVGGIGTGASTDKATGVGSNVDGLVNNIRIVGNYFEEALTEAIDINWHTQNVLIEGNTFYNCNTDGTNEVIDVGGDTATTTANQCRNITIVDNHLVNDGGVSPTSAIQIKGRSNDVLIAGNTITRSGATGDVGIRIWNTDDVVVRDNFIDGYGNGITATATTENLPQRVTISGNIVRNYDTDGISISGINFVISNNIIEGTGSTDYGIEGITLTRSVIEGNVVKSATISGIRLQSACSDIIVSNNFVEQAGLHGIRTEGGDRMTLTGNIVKNCGKTASIGDGLSVATGSTYCVITGNQCYDDQGTKTQRYGINIGVSDRCIINNNLFYPNLTGGMNGTGALTNSLVGTAGNISA